MVNKINILIQINAFAIIMNITIFLNSSYLGDNDN